MYHVPAGEQAPHFPSSLSSAAPSNSHNVLRCCALTFLNLGYPYPLTKRGIGLVANLIGLKIFIPGLVFWWVFLRMGICLSGNVLLKPVTCYIFFLAIYIHVLSPSYEFLENIFQLLPQSLKWRLVHSASWDFLFPSTRLGSTGIYTAHLTASFACCVAWTGVSLSFVPWLTHWENAKLLFILPPWHNWEL